MNYTTGYLIGAVAFNGLFVFRTQNEDSRIAFVLSVIWPLSALIVAGILLLDLIGWDVEFAKGTKAFGFRRPTNPKVKGFAITVFSTEFQFYSSKA